jgi:hypothetical protein
MMTMSLEFIRSPANIDQECCNAYHILMTEDQCKFTAIIILLLLCSQHGRYQFNSCILVFRIIPAALPLIAGQEKENTTMTDDGRSV